jgi:hypothetical protein
MFFTTLVINPGAILETAGFRVFANVSIVNDGTIEFTPGDATPGIGANAPRGSLPQSRSGQSGGFNGTAPGNALFPGTTGFAGNGGNAGVPPGGAGEIGAVSSVIDPHLGGMDLVLFGVTWAPLRPTVPDTLSWGASGGAGAPRGLGVFGGGGGGSGGGVIVLSSPTITGTGVVRARGGNGGAGIDIGNGNTGGGGGGGQGGVIALITDDGASPIATDVPGGLGGPAGTNPGSTAGTDGSPGVVRQYPTLA